MQINPTDPIPTVASEARSSEHVTQHRPTPPVAKHAAHTSSENTDPTNVVVEMQKDEIVVYKFIDKSTGKLVQQIPSQQLINISNAIDDALSSLQKPKEQK